MRLQRILIFAAILAATLTMSTALVAQARDNFLILVADDLGVDALGVYSRDDLYGHPGEGADPGPTPNLDSLALQGILFRHAYASPTCSPTRASTLTGRFPFRIGIGDPEGAILALDETILPEVLAATHANGVAGKWHIGGNLNNIDHPIDSGFNSYAGAYRGGVDDYYLWDKTTNSVSTTGSTQTGVTTYVSTDNVDEAIALISEFGEDPWLVWLAFNAPHSPFHVPPEELITMVVDEGSPTEDLYRAAVEAMDTEIGRLLDAIPLTILADTTIVFAGDNGTPRQGVLAPFIPSRSKGSVYEGGVNVPFIVKSPWIDPSDQGSESLALVHTIDLFATLAEIAGTSASTAEDSVSLVPYLQDPTLPTLSARLYAYAESFSPNGDPPYDSIQRAMRGERYKLIWRDGSFVEFYDLDLDRWESNNLLASPLDPEAASAFAELTRALGDLHDTLFEDGFESGDVHAWH